MAALSAALELTSQRGWQQQYEVTVYQMGWRLGGKGASSRNPDAAWRIEEHGLHVWFGCYDNAFRLLRGVYEELDRPEGTRFATIDSAFTPGNSTPYFEQDGAAWSVWPVWFPPSPDKPGTGGPDPSAWDDLVKLIELVAHAAVTLLHLSATGTAAAPAEAAQPAHAGILDWLSRHLPHPAPLDIETSLAGAVHLVRTLPADPAAHPSGAHEALAWLLERARGWLLSHVDPSRGKEFRRAAIELDLGLTAAIGCLRDNVPSAGYGAIDGEDLRAWLARHGARATSVDSAPIRALYDLYLAYVDGDRNRPGLAAGVGLHAVSRLGAGYKGAVVNEMKAGMGEIVIAPIYQALAARGVKFAFFHRVTRLELSPDRARVARVHLARQVDLADGTITGYRPLFDVDGVPCWPPAPFGEQIRDAGRLAGVDLESRWSGWKDVGECTLEDGRDFDVAVLGMSLGAIRDVADDLRADAAWANLLDRTGVTQSISVQLWMDSSLSELGWTYGSVPTDAAPEPLDVWADRTELLPLERWEAPPPRSLQYVTGAMAGDLYQRPPSDAAVPAEALAEARRQTIAWLEGQSQAMFPAARTPAGDFDWGRLHAPAGATGQQRLDAQYLRANVDPAELYVLSLPGTTAYRMAADGSGFANLILAGDWTRTSWNVGCIEAAAESGVNAAAAVARLAPTLRGRRPA